MAYFTDHLTVFVRDVLRELPSHRTFATVDRVLLVPQVDRHVRREDFDRVDALAADAIEHLVGELVTFLDEQHILGALALGLRLLRSGLGRVLGRGFAGQRNIFGDDRPQHLTLLAAALALLGEIELAHGEEEPENIRVRSVPKRTEEGGRREFLFLVDVDVDHVMDVDRELDPRAAEWDDPGRDQSLSIGMRRLFKDHSGRSMQLAHDDALGTIDHEGA